MPELTIAATETTVDVDNDYLPIVDVSETPDGLNKVTPAVLLGEVLKSLRTLTDPGADRVPFWDESVNAVAWLTPGTGLSITGTTLNSASGISIGNEVTSSTTFNDLIVTAGADPGTIYHGIVTADFPITTAYAVPSNLFFDFVKGAVITDGGGGEIDFEGIGLLKPLAQFAYFGGFAADDITWSSTAADERPAAVSTELWDTGNTSLSDRLARANAAFGTKQVKIVAHPRTITGGSAFEPNENTEIYFSPGNYPNTFSHTSGNHAAFGINNNVQYHGPRSAVINESLGTFGCRIFQAANLNNTYTDVIIEGFTIKGDPSAVADGSGSTILMGNCHNSSVRNVKIEDQHNFGVLLGGSSSTGNYAYNSEVVGCLFTKASNQTIAAINYKNCRIDGNWGSGTTGTRSGEFIDIEPNQESDYAENIVVENNVFIVLDDYNGVNTLGGIVFQSSGTPGIRGVVCRNNTIWGPHPADYVPTTFDSRLATGIGAIGVLDGVFENNTVRWAFGNGYSFSQCSRLIAKNNHAIGCGDSAGFGAAMRVLGCVDSHIEGAIHKAIDGGGSATAIYEQDSFFTATSAGSNLTLTSGAYQRFYAYHAGRSLFFNGTVYTIVNPTDAIAHVASATDIDIGTDVITRTAHGYDNGDILRYQMGTTLIGGLTNGQFVYVVNKNANDFQVAATEGGAAINLTGTGTGTQIFVPHGMNTTTRVAKMTASIGTVTTKTFTDANVNTGADTITITAHGYQTGCIANLSTAGTLPTFATNPVTFPSMDGIAHWYVIRIDADTIQLATTLALALAGTEALIDTAGSGTITVTPEVQTRYSSNYYSNNFASGGITLEKTGASQILSTAHDRYITPVADAGLALTTAHGIILHTGTTAPRTDPLPDATICKGKELQIVDGTSNAGTHNITLDPVTAGQTVNNAATYVINGDNGSATVKSNGTNWFVVASILGTEPPPPTSFTYIGGREATQSGNLATTSSLDCTGATVFVMGVSYLAGAAPTPSDEIGGVPSGNTWTAGTEYTSGAGNGRFRFFYSVNPIVDAAQVFKCTSATQFHSIVVDAFAGTVDSTPVDGQVGAGNASATTQQPGSITPSENDCLVVSGALYIGTSNATVDSGFTLTNTLGDASNFCVAMAYEIQTTAAAKNPTWSSNGAAERMVAASIVFKHS